MHGDATEPLCLPAAFVHSWAVRRPFQQPTMCLLEFRSQIVPKQKLGIFILRSMARVGHLFRLFWCFVFFFFLWGQKGEKDSRKGKKSRQQLKKNLYIKIRKPKFYNLMLLIKFQYLFWIASFVKACVGFLGVIELQDQNWTHQTDWSLTISQPPLNLR